MARRQYLDTPLTHGEAVKWKSQTMLLLMVAVALILIGYLLDAVWLWAVAIGFFAAAASSARATRRASGRSHGDRE